MAFELRHRRPAPSTVVVLGLLALSACGSTSEDAATSTDTGGDPVPVTTAAAVMPTPAEMCPVGERPFVAAMDIRTGDFRWASCGTEDGTYRWLIAATDEAVFSEWYDTQPRVAALSAVDGRPVDVEEIPPNPDPASGGGPIIVDGVEITGGQEGPTRGDGPAGTWEQPGVWVYGDVAAIGDGAVFAIERGDATTPSQLVGYELETGDVRWSVPIQNTYWEGAWPYLVDGQRLFTLWSELQVRSTVDGTLLWQTDYVDPTTAAGDLNEPIRLTGVRTSSDTVFVAFSTTASGGD